MPDREKVITDVEEAIKILGKVDEPTFWLDFVRVAVENALKLLKGHEPVPPIPYQQDTSIGFFAGFKCGNCNAVVFHDYRFCPICGKAVKWDWVGCLTGRK